MKQIDWDKRIQRAEDLARRHSNAAEVLAFYRHILEFQRTLRDGRVLASAPAASEPKRFQELLDVDIAMPHFPALLALVQKVAPPKLGARAAEIGRVASEQQRQMLLEFLSPAGGEDTTSDPFFARALLQPYAEASAQNVKSSAPDSARAICPVCSSRPQLAVLRPEGDGGKRFLVCSFCATEWEFRRVLCPYCGEVDHEKLPRYSAEEFLAVRVEACDTCKYYLKSVDLTIDGLAVPRVDEVATTSLDLWAAEHGYTKIKMNLMGF